jgi:hypothetical protein
MEKLWKIVPKNEKYWELAIVVAKTEKEAFKKVKTQFYSSQNMKNFHIHEIKEGFYYHCT